MSDPEAIRQALRSAAYDEALAEHLGLNATDLRSFELVMAEPGLTPGRLAELTGLTTGAVTGVVDRLEKAGYVARRPDPADRRSVTIHPDAARGALVRGALEPLARAAQRALSAHDAGARRAISAYLAAAAELTSAEAARLRATSRGGFLDDVYTAPLGDAARGRLIFASGAPRVALNFAPFGPQATARIIMETSASRLSFAGAAPASELIRATFVGPRPDVRAVDGVVTVRYRRRPFASRSGSIALNGAIPWTIELGGGITDLEGSLVGVPLTRIEVRGGANHLKLDLPKPAGTVAISVKGVASSASFRRPSGIPVALRVNGGVSQLRLDGRRTGQVAGDRKFVSDGFATSPDRYEIEILGGARDVRIGTLER